VIILDIIEFLFMGILPTTMGYVILHYIFFVFCKSSSSPKNEWVQHLKYVFVFFSGFFIIVLIITTMSLNIFVVASVFKTYEIENAETIATWIKDVYYICIEGAWSVTGAVVILYIYQHIGRLKLLPGDGSVKQRIRQIIKEVVR